MVSKRVVSNLVTKFAGIFSTHLVFPTRRAGSLTWLRSFSISPATETVWALSIRISVFRSRVVASLSSPSGHCHGSSKNANCANRVSWLRLERKLPKS